MIRLCCTVLALTACASPRPVAPRAVCAPANDAAVVQVVRDMYTALTTDDAAAASRLFTPAFYAFDGGERLSGPELFAMVKTLHAAGKVFTWNVEAPDVHRACDLAWATWTNVGAVTADSARTEVTWIESAVLRWTDGAWRMAFFHSSRAKR